VSNARNVQAYDAFHIVLCSSYEYMHPTYHVMRDGRTILSTASKYEQAMFAEELYERLSQTRREASPEGARE
jgi:hypothetical protein